MNVRLVFVPPGGGEADYSLDFDLPSIPQVGDYITIGRPGQLGTEDFKDSKPYETNDNLTQGTVKMIAVECEFAKGAYSSEEHKRACDGYGASEFEASAF
jgi:hypothetical protein